MLKAGVVAGHREATNWDHPDQAIGTMPGLAATERRASHVAAWQALGQPEAGLDATAMTEGRLRIRVRAAELEKAWAPPHADDALRTAEIGAESARQAAALAYAAVENATRLGDHDTASVHLTAAAGHDADHTLRTAALEPLTVTVTARAAWAAATAVTLDEGTRATAELTRRGLTPGTEPDRTTTPAWLRTHHPGADASSDADAAAAAERATNRARAITAAEQAVADHATSDTDDQDEDQVEDRGSDYDAVEHPAEHDDQPVDGHDPAAIPDSRSPELLEEPAEHRWGHSRGPEAAYDVVPVTTTLDDLHATAAIAAVAPDRATAHAHQDRPPVDTAHLDDHTDSTRDRVDRHDDHDGTD